MQPQEKKNQHPANSLSSSRPTYDAYKYTFSKAAADREVISASVSPEGREAFSSTAETTRSGKKQEKEWNQPCWRQSIIIIIFIHKALKANTKCWIQRWNDRSSCRLESFEETATEHDVLSIICKKRRERHRTKVQKQNLNLQSWQNEDTLLIWEFSNISSSVILSQRD